MRRYYVAGNNGRRLIMEAWGSSGWRDCVGEISRTLRVRGASFRKPSGILLAWPHRGSIPGVFLEQSRGQFRSEHDICRQNISLLSPVSCQGAALEDAPNRERMPSRIDAPPPTSAECAVAVVGPLSLAGRHETRRRRVAPSRDSCPTELQRIVSSSSCVGRVVTR